MVYNEQELLPFEQVKNELHSLCVNGQSGDFCLFTEQRHAAVISINNGAIVGLRYRISRGTEALKLIKLIKKAKIKFKKSESNEGLAVTNGIPPTMDIFKFLGVKSNGEAEQNTHKKILVVEDSLTQRKVICRMLSQNGFDVSQASDGYEALAQLGKIKPDLILLDVIMPGIDGYKVMSLIKERPDMKDIPIIMLTSRDGLIDKMRGKVSDTDEYLTKPFVYEELITKIDKYLFTDDGDGLLNCSAIT